MRRHPLAFFASALLFFVLLAILVWRGLVPLHFLPHDSRETVFLSAVSIVIFLLAVTLAFILFRDGIKLYIDRQRQREGSRIRSKLLFGALLLTVAPTLFSALFNYAVLNRTLEKWFTLPARGIVMNLKELDKSYRQEAQERVQAEADWIGLLPETRDAAQTSHPNAVFFKAICEQRRRPPVDPHPACRCAHSAVSIDKCFQFAYSQCRRLDQERPRRHRQPHFGFCDGWRSRTTGEPN